MPTLLSGQRSNYIIQRGDVLTIEADALGSGQVWFIASGKQDTLAKTITAGQKFQFGPYLEQARIRVECTEGWFNITDDPIDNFTPSQLGALSLTTKMVDGSNFNVVDIYNLTATLGDSTVAQAYVDASTRRNRSSYNHFTIGNALAGNRAIVVYKGGVSGERTDQTLARLAAALASGAGTLYVSEGINSIGQAPYTHAVTGQSVTDANVGAIALADTVTKAEQALALGKRVIICTCHGSAAFTAAKIGQLAVYNAGLRRFAEGRPNVWLFDSASILKNLLTSTTSVLAYKAGYMRTGETATHESSLGAYFVGKQFATVLREVMRPLPRFNVGNDEQYVAGVSRTQIAPNPAFTGTTGTLGTGITGTAPDSWSVNRVSGDTTTTAVCAIEAATDGGGNWLRIDYTASANNGGVRVQFSYAYNSPAWVIGDQVQLSSEIEVVSGAAALAYVTNMMTTFDGTSNVSTYGMLGDTAGAGPMPSTEGYVFQQATEVLTVPDHSVNGSYLLIQPLEARWTGAGTGTIRVRMPRCEVRT